MQISLSNEMFVEDVKGFEVSFAPGLCVCLCEPGQSNVKHCISGTFFKYKNVKDAKAFKFRKESELFHSIYALFPYE